MMEHSLNESHFYWSLFKLEQILSNIEKQCIQTMNEISVQQTSLELCV